jgi:hypothetical protein
MIDLPAFSPAHVLGFGRESIASLAFSRSGASLYIALLKSSDRARNDSVRKETEAFDARIVEVEVATGRVVRTLRSGPEPVDSLRMTPDGTALLARGFGRERLLIDIESGETTRRYAVPDPAADAGMEDKVDLIGYDCRTIYRVGLDTAQAKTCVFAIDLETGKTQRVAETGVCRSRPSDLVLIRKKVSLIPGSPPELLEFSCRQRGLGPPGGLQVRDLAQDGAVVRTIGVETGVLGPPVFSSDGRQAFVPDKAYRGKIRVWDLETGRERPGFQNTPDGYEPQWSGGHCLKTDCLYMPFYQSIPGPQGLESKRSVILVGAASARKWVAQLTYIEGTVPRERHMLTLSPNGRTVAAACVRAGKAPGQRLPPVLMLWDVSGIGQYFEEKVD